MALAEAAESFVGSRFRLHGRDARTGLDCVGLVSASFEAIGNPFDAPVGYGLRNLEIAPHLRSARMPNLAEVSGTPGAGDIILFRLSSHQFHLGIISLNGSLLHAHAGLGRVVLTPPPFRWKIEKHWRIAS